MVKTVSDATGSQTLQCQRVWSATWTQTNALYPEVHLWPYISMTSLAEPPVAQAILATPFQTLLATPGSAEIRTHV